MTLDGQIALVTGAAQGIGRGCALELARAGADIVFNDRSESELTESLKAEIEGLGRRAVCVAGDLFERASCEQIVSQAIEAFGHLSLLVSNPAFSRRSPFLEYDPDLFERVIRGTLTSGFHISQLFARHLVARGQGGKMVLISSVHARRPYSGAVAYNAAKSGLNHMAATIAAELLPYRINVNVIEPGWIETPGEIATFGAARIAEEGPKLPWGRLGQPEEIGKAAAFLCSSSADYITGTSLVVDGGFCLRDAISTPAKL